MKKFTAQMLRDMLIETKEKTQCYNPKYNTPAREDRPY